jgi:putative transposase
MSMMTARRRRSFTLEFKAQTVDLLRTSGKSVGEVCRDLDLTETVVRRWLAQADIDTGQRDGLTTTEREELSRLRRENRVLRQEREIRRKAAAFFAKGDDPLSRYRFIAAEKAQHSVAQLCRVVQVAPSGYYAWQHRQPSRRTQANLTLTEQIRAIHDRSRCTYGARRIHAELREGEQRISRKRVARLMRQAGLVGRPPRRFRPTTDPDEQAQVQDLVQRQFTAIAPDQKWFADITYVRTWEGWLYLAVIIDAYSRKVVGWSMADHLRTELATAALTSALTTRRPLEHGQYTSSAYSKLLSTHDARQSVGRPGTCWDNAVAESFFATLKAELIYRHVWPTRRQAELAIFQFIAGWSRYAGDPAGSVVLCWRSMSGYRAP